MRWLNFSAMMITFVFFWFLFSQLFWKELTNTRIAWIIVGMVVELGVCALNAWLYISGEIKYRKDLKRLKEVQNLDK